MGRWLLMIEKGNYFRPWLFLPAHWTYSLSPWALKVYRQIRPTSSCLWRSFSWRGMDFSNPLGTAGGVDKNALNIQDWQSLGAGFVEIGTVTPEPQKPNPGEILDRSLRHKSLWNNMGSPNKGLNFVRQRLSLLPSHSGLAKNFPIEIKNPAPSLGKDVLPQTEPKVDKPIAQNGNFNAKTKNPIPIFINIGKNRETPISQAVEDYKKSLKALQTFASAFVINISSPNTEGLRDLFDKKTLPQFLKSIKGAMQDLNLNTPLILKISPDETDFLRIVDQSIEAGVDGWSVCNSTSERKIPGLFPKKGGISGKLLANKSLSLLKQLKKHLSRNRAVGLVISCGGVLTAEDALERLEEGADLVQVYSALVFEGPGFFRSVFKKLS